MAKSFALDISDHSIETVVLVGKFDKPKIQSSGRVILKPGIVENGEIKNKDELAKAIKRVMAKAKPEPIKDDDVLISVPDSRVFTHIFNLPAKLKDEQIAGIIENDLENTFPVQENEIYWDYKVIAKKEDKKEVFVAAIFRSIVHDLIEVCKQLNLEIKTLDLEANALARILVTNGDRHSSLLLDIGARTTKASYFDEEGINFISVLDMGGEKLNDSVAKKMKISAAKAEEKRKELGVIKPKGRKKNKVLAALEDDLKHLTKEIKTVIEYCQKKSGHKINTVILSGGVALMKGLVPYLKSALEVEVKLGKSIVEIKNARRNVKGPLFFSVMGLSRRGLMRNFDEVDINFLVGKNRAQKTKKKTEGAASTSTHHFSGKLVLLIGVLFLSLALLAGVYVAKQKGYIGTKQSAKKNVSIVANTNINASQPVFVFKDIKLTVDVSESGQGADYVKGQTLSVIVEGEQIFNNEDEKVLQSKIDQGKETLTSILIDEKIYNLNNEDQYQQDIILKPELDINIQESSSSVAAGSTEDTFSVKVKAEPELLLISKNDLVSGINSEITDPDQKIEITDLDDLKIEINKYISKDNLVELVINKA